MEVIDKRKKARRKSKFSSLNEGATFMWQDDLYMKSSGVTENDSPMNAVEFSDGGYHGDIPDDERITPVNIEITIHD